MICQEHNEHFNPVEASLLFATFNNNNNNNSSALTARNEPSLVIVIIIIMSMKEPRFIRS